MSQYYNEFNFQFLYNQIDLLKLEQHKNENKMIELNNIIEYLLSCYKSLEETKQWQKNKSDCNTITKKIDNKEKHLTFKEVSFL